MRILSVGKEFSHKDVTNSNFRDANSFWDYDVVILYLDNILDNYCDGYDLHGDDYEPYYLDSGGTYIGYKEKELMNDILRRDREIKDLYLSDTVIFSFIPKKEINRHSIFLKIFDFDIDLFNYLLEKNCIFKECKLDNYLLVTDNRAIEEFLTNNKQNLFFDNYIENCEGMATLVMSKGLHTIFGEFQDSNLYVIPKYNPPENEKVKSDQRFIGSIINIVNSKNTNEEKPIIRQFSLPNWCKSYYIGKEKSIAEQKSNLDAKMTKLKEEIQDKKNVLAQLNNYKALIFGADDDPLKKEVTNILSELGFTINTPNKPNRTDIIMTYQANNYVVEVKGKTKSAAEKDAAQLEKWVSEYIAEHNKKPKGLLIINGYKDKTLEERIDPVFPNQMLEYSTKREHCLISTVQLLGLYFDCKNNPEQKEKMIAELFNTNGVFEHYKDWKKFITIDKAES